MSRLMMMLTMITMIKGEPDGYSNAKEGKSALQNMVNTCSFILTSLFFAKKVRKENLHEKWKFFGWRLITNAKFFNIVNVKLISELCIQNIQDPFCLKVQIQSASLCEAHIRTVFTKPPSFLFAFFLPPNIANHNQPILAKLQVTRPVDVKFTIELCLQSLPASFLPRAHPNDVGSSLHTPETDPERVLL